MNKRLSSYDELCSERTKLTTYFHFLIPEKGHLKVVYKKKFRLQAILINIHIHYYMTIFRYIQCNLNLQNNLLIPMFMWV